DMQGAQDAINAKIREQRTLLEQTNAAIGEGGEMGFVAYAREAEQIEKNIAFLQKLGQAVTDAQGKIRAESAVTTAQLGKDVEEQTNKAEREADRLARETTAAAVRLQEELKKVKLPSSDTDLFAAMGQ